MQCLLLRTNFIAGNGDIVPATTEGKVFTLCYALYGIPVFAENVLS